MLSFLVTSVGYLSITRFLVCGIGKSITLEDDDGCPRFLEGVRELAIEINVDAKFWLKPNKSITFFFGKLIASASFLYSNRELQVVMSKE